MINGPINGHMISIRWVDVKVARRLPRPPGTAVVQGKAQADALGAELPPVADSMRLLWVVAVEHGERVFEQRRAELEAQLEAVSEQLAVVETAREQADATNVLLKQQITTSAQQLTLLRRQLTAETAAKNEVASQAQALQQELNHSMADNQLDHFLAKKS